MTDRGDAIAIINHLIEISQDAEQGFLQSSEHVHDLKLKAYFLHRSHEARQSYHELQALVREMGGRPADAASISGFLHRRWKEIKSVVSGDDGLVLLNDVDVLNEVERGETVAFNAYKAASAQALPAMANLAVLRHLKAAERNLDEVKQLRGFAELKALAVTEKTILPFIKP